MSFLPVERGIQLDPATPCFFSNYNELLQNPCAYPVMSIIVINDKFIDMANITRLPEIVFDCKRTEPDDLSVLLSTKIFL